MSKKRPEGIETYDAPAGGWGALRAVAKTLSQQQVVAQGTTTLLKANQPDGFDCPGCAWPDPKHTSSFEFCENGAKAITWESTAKRVGPSFFADNSVSDLWHWTDHKLEDAGRLTHPLVYDRDSDRYVPIEWDEAYRLIGTELNKLPDPHMAEFYTSGRASNRLPSCSSSLCAPTAPTISPTARTCATRRPASDCRNRLASARAR